MDRSMVQELNGLSSSQFINNRSTFISTAFNDGDYELRKSRIQNLPSYRKEDMSSRVNFVVVFQSIQIERLSSEVEALRVALKDAERQNFNVHNYQVQIRQLTEKCFAYEREREQYRDEIDKLNMICQKLYEELETMKSRFSDIDPTIKQKYRLQKERTQRLEEELEKWRARYSALETSKNREMEDMKLMMESQRKSMIDRQIKELSLRFNSERQNLQKEIRKLREALDSKDMELKRVNGRVSQLQILNQELRRYEKTIDEYENKFAMISQETVRLNDLLRHKQEDIERLNGEIANLKRRIADLERKLRQAEEGGERVRGLEDQLRDWRARYSKIEQQNRDYKQQLSKIPEFKQAIQQISNETDKLKDVVRQKMGQIDEWKSRYQRVESQFRQNKAQQEQKLPVLENKVNQLNTENDRLNVALKSRAGEIENWKNKLSDMERQMAKFANVEQDKRNLQNQLNNQVRQINDLQGNIRQLEPQVKRLGDVQRDLSNQRNRVQETKKQIDRLNNAVRSASEKADSFERKCANLQRDLKTFTQIQQELRVYKQKEINLTKQIDRINGIISEKIKEIQALKETFQRLEKGLSQYQGIERKLIDSVNQTQKLIQDLDQSRKQAGFLQDKLIASQSEVKKLKNDVFGLSQQKQQIVRLVNSKTQQLQQAKLETVQLQSQIGQLRQKEARLRQVQQNLRVTENNLNEIDRKLKSEQNRSRELNQTLEQASAQLNKIKREGMMSPKFKEEFFELRSQSEQRERQFRSLQQRISTIEGIIKKLREAAIKQDQITKRNTDKFGAIAKQFDASAQAMKKMFDLQSEVQRLSQENLQLEGKLKIMGIENANYKQSYANRGNLDSDKQIGGPIGSLGSMGSIGSTTSKRSESAPNQFDPQLTKNSSFTNVTTTTNTRYLQPSNSSQLNVSNVLKSPNNTYGFVSSQSNASSTANANRTQSYVNLDAFKKTPQTGSDQYQSEPPRFQFRTNNKSDF